MKKESWAIVALSRDSVVLATRLRKHLEDKQCTLYTKEKYAKEGMELIEGDISSFMDKTMRKHGIICCLMATGIVVRAIAPHLDHKSVDPGILVIDTKGDYVISLLSGHLGGGNDAARLVAERMGAQAVITTGTDVKGSLAVDILGEKIGCCIDNFTDAKNITALILNDEEVLFVNDEQVDLRGIILPQNIKLVEKTDHLGEASGIIYTSISQKNIEMGLPSVKLVPKKIVIGIGCRKNTPGSRIIEAVKTTLEALELNEKGVKLFSTIELKSEEPGIIEACAFFKAKIKIVPHPMVQMVQSRFEASEFVFETTGLYAVSEPCGYVASGFGKCLLEKQKIDGITLSVWSE
ncbi:MAG: cobalt-precorrin 5A hydrolase [Eubacteriaceae bacterium]